MSLFQNRRVNKTRHFQHSAVLLTIERAELLKLTVTFHLNTLPV